MALFPPAASLFRALCMEKSLDAHGSPRGCAHSTIHVALHEHIRISPSGRFVNEGWEIRRRCGWEWEWKSQSELDAGDFKIFAFTFFLVFHFHLAVSPMSYGLYFTMFTFALSTYDEWRICQLKLSSKKPPLLNTVPQVLTCRYKVVVSCYPGNQLSKISLNKFFCCCGLWVFLCCAVW